jgi:nucleoside-diphosphate-sugar epimerase
MKKILVCGAGGFIGGHLVAHLRKSHPAWLIRAVDIKPYDEWYQRHEGVDNRSHYDLRDRGCCMKVAEGCGTIYNLAADMGGMGFIENNKAACMLSVLINTHLLQAAKEHNVNHYFYASSACVYAADKQTEPQVVALREEDAYPAMPEDGYGWEKLFSERMCRHFHEDFGLDIRIARFHNVYGPHGTWDGGREKAPAAICRKVAMAKLTGKHEIDIWGDGTQTRSFMWIGDCIEGISKLQTKLIPDPINLGSSELVSVNRLVTIVEDIADIRCHRNYQFDKPKGVRGRNSDNTLIKQYLGWEPSTKLADGLAKTYEWVFNQLKARDEL